VRLSKAVTLVVRVGCWLLAQTIVDDEEENHSD
jgi:hypothetical protein